MTPRGAKKLPQPEPFAVIVSGGQFDIIVEEKTSRPGYVVMRRWIRGIGDVKGRWGTRAIGHMELRDVRGAVRPEATAAAKDAGIQWYRELTGAEASTTAVEKEKVFTIGETWAFLSNEDTGAYPRKTPFRSEIQRALDYAVTIWGADRPWASVQVSDWRTLIRRRIAALVKNKKTGIRATEITVSRIITATRKLQAEKKIAPGAAAIHPDWHDEMVAFWKGLTNEAHDPEPHQPRYTLDESQRLIVAAEQTDPRMALLVYIGAELRLGQVGRAKRSQLDLDAKTFEIRGAGDKRGTTIDLLESDVRAFTRALGGHLRLLEAGYQSHGTDYYLFPGGHLLHRRTGKRVVQPNPQSERPWSREARNDWWLAIEVLAGVEHQKGRGPYGIRRVAVDVAIADGISEAGLQNLGGWSSTDVPRKVYAEKANRSGRRDAKPIRSKLRRGAD